MAILALLILLVSLAPSLMAGGQCIAQFMVGARPLAWLALTLACMAAVVASGVMAISGLGEDVGISTRVLAALVFVVPTWAVYGAGFWLIERKTT